MELRNQANIDLVTQILIRLPVKPLVRFKCVSKQWFSLISDTQFCLSHTRHHHRNSTCPTATAILLKKAYDYTPQFQIFPLKCNTIPKVAFFNYLNSPGGFRIRQSCNGLLLCSSYTDKNCRKLSRSRHYHICNPTTRQFKRLSSPTTHEFKESSVWVYMAFDPLKSNHYKVISVHKLNWKMKYQIDMYSSETDSWSTLGITFTPPNGMHFPDAVFCNGAVHWHSTDETSLYFDVDRECLNTMPMPKIGERWNNHKVQYFGESQGHLHLIVTEWPPPLQFHVLEMAPDYSAWFVRYHVNLDAVRTAFPELIWYRDDKYRFSVLDLIRAQKEEDSIVVVSVDKKVIFYNVHDGTSKKLYDLELPVTNDYTWSETFQYFEILTSV